MINTDVVSTLLTASIMGILYNTGMRLSLCIATHNEEKNIADCIKSIKNFVDEVVVVDGASSDDTVKIARELGAHVIVTDNPAMFHINKQKALDEAHGDWIVQLDADERVTKPLAEEILQVIQMDQDELEEYEKNLPQRELFLRHEALIEKRDGVPAKKEGAFVAFYMPRVNYFLGKYLRYGGVYPDGAIRLIKRGSARFPMKNVHEVMQVDGRIGWLQHDLLHIDSPTFSRYLERNNRYINYLVEEFRQEKLPKNFVNFFHYIILKPVSWFLMTQIRHKGILDGYQGIVFSFFSALRFPRAYLRYQHR